MRIDISFFRDAIKKKGCSLGEECDRSFGNNGEEGLIMLETSTQNLYINVSFKNNKHLCQNKGNWVSLNKNSFSYWEKYTSFNEFFVCQ